jgi:preprotein translocase subunit SecA
VTRLEDKSNLRFSYALLDEVDSILIDESQNPLIISQR